MRGMRITDLLATGVLAALLVLGGCKKGKDSADASDATKERPLPSGTMSLQGMYRYMADAGLFLDCATREQWPVAMEADNAALERAYAKAEVAAIGSGDCGLTDGSSPGDWRLPTLAEWQTTLAQAEALGCTNPILTNADGSACAVDYNDLPFTGVVDGHYWTSTVVGSDPSRAWRQAIYGPYTLEWSKTDQTLVWPVRDGK